jgi:hypothetical protein
VRAARGRGALAAVRAIGRRRAALVQAVPSRRTHVVTPAGRRSPQHLSARESSMTAPLTAEKPRTTGTGAGALPSWRSEGQWLTYLHHHSSP